LAWLHAAEPYAPLHGIAGVSWTPVDVRVEHIPAGVRWRHRPGAGSGTGGQST
jgi:hypothetical protein